MNPTVSDQPVPSPAVEADLQPADSSDDGLTCPNCGERTTFTDHSAEHVETHGLDSDPGCGPYEHCYEEWMTCDKCGAQTDDKEVRQANPDLEAAF